MSNTYVSKYPSIVVDKAANSVNESLKKVVTVEEYYDLRHHTHDIATLAVAEGSMTYNEMQTTVTELLETINDLNTTVQEQNNTIQEQNNTIVEQNNTIKRIEEANEELRKAIETINNELSNMASISDWDVETPGNQDANGNNLGDLMGFTMTEIKD